MENNKIRQVLINNGIKNLNEFGYPDVNEHNLLTDLIYASFFQSMLKQSREIATSKSMNDIVSEIDALLFEVENNLING